jgi:hypothetical protein
MTCEECPTPAPRRLPLPCASTVAPRGTPRVLKKLENTKRRKGERRVVNRPEGEAVSAAGLESQTVVRSRSTAKSLSGLEEKEGSGTDLRRRLGPRASRIPHAHVTALPSARSTFPSPAHTSAQSDSSVRLNPHDGLHHRLQRRREGGGCPRATRRSQAQRRRPRRGQGFRDARAVQEGTSLECVALSFGSSPERIIEKASRGVAATRPNDFPRKWIGGFAPSMPICALADATPPPPPADRAHGRPRARQGRRG